MFKPGDIYDIKNSSIRIKVELENRAKVQDFILNAYHSICSSKEETIFF
jgi:hypothetical protein